MKYNLPLIPFLLKDVALKPDLNLNDDGSDQAFKKKILSDINLKTNPKATQQTVDVSSTKEDGVEIKGLVLEETKTKLPDFCVANDLPKFFANRNAPPNSISIKVFQL